MRSLKFGLSIIFHLNVFFPEHSEPELGIFAHLNQPIDSEYYLHSFIANLNILIHFMRTDHRHHL